MTPSFNSELIDALRICGKLSVDDLLMLLLSLGEMDSLTEEQMQFANAASVMLEYRCPSKTSLN